MDELFGISMDVIMYVLLALLALSLISVAYVALANRVMFKLGVRNIPRRVAQTTLIVIGLMLSTVIISAAFTTGDTVDRSITSQVYTVLGSLDEVLQLRSEDEQSFDDPTQALVRDQAFSAAAVDGLVASLAASSSIDFVIPAYSAVAVAVNPQKRLSSPDFNIVGLDPARASDLPDIESLDGRRLALTSLAAGELYVNESAADELDAGTGDTIQVIAGSRTLDYRIKEVVKDRRLAGAGGLSVRREGAVMPLAAAQDLFQAPGQLTMVAVSNKGNARQGYELTSKAEADIEAALRAQAGAPPLQIVPLKQTGVTIAEFGANILTTFFLVFGLFSIGAGILLIFLIFVMLAAERKPEMGMARAVGTKRLDIVQTFMAEGMAYNIGAALAGALLGVLVAFVMSQVMASLFAQFDINISPHVTPRSLIISYALGVVLTFLTVTFSSWRVSFINIVRAIRDIPEPPSQKPAWRAHGLVRTLLRLVFKPGRGRRAWLVRTGVLVAGIVLQMAAGAAGSGAVQIVVSILGGLLLVFFVFLTFQWGFLFLILSLPLILIGAGEKSAFLLLLGLSLAPLGLAFIARSFGANDRLVYTLTGVFLIYIWEIDFSVGLLERIFGQAEGDIEMFFLSGVMVTIAATFVVVYNADFILEPLTHLGRRLGALLPSLKMAVAYPLANRARTGMTMAMFCLVIFALTVMSAMNHNFNRLYLSDTSRGGWDIIVDENPSNPIDDLERGLGDARAEVKDEIEAVGAVSVATRLNARVCEERPGRACTDKALESYTVWGESASFLASGSVPLQARARGYESESAVWQALATDPSLAVVDANAIAGGGFGFGFISGIRPNQAEFDPVSVRVVNNQTGAGQTVKVIGVVQSGASTTFSALHISQAAFERTFPAADARRFFVRLEDGNNAKQAARDIESALLTTGAQAESIREQINELTSVQRGFFYLLQGFMALGLLVGVAAVGVVAFRTVVERRQQIGMLRALGYTRAMVGLTFLIESAFIAFMGIVSGVVFALILAWQLINDEFSNQGVTTFSVPWVEVLAIIALAFGAAMLMTLIPSRQAARIPIAEALRYE
jgi:putative ABC transport system permease protein